MSNKIPRLQNFALLAQLKCFRDTNSKRSLSSASKCAYATSRIYSGESNPLNNEDPRVIIIGAGLSGLSAADYLISKGLENVLVLEASNRYGGRIHSIKLGHSFCELGASWINVTKSPYCMYELAKKCGLIDRKDVFKKTDNEVFITSSGDPVQDDMVQLATLLFTNIIDRSENFLELKQAEDEKSLDLRKYFDSEISSILEKLIAKEQITIRKVFNGLLRDLSNTFGSDLGYVSVKQLGIRTKIFSSPVYLCTGLQKIFNQLVKRIPLNQLLLEKPIGNIRWGNLDVGEKPYVKCLDGTKYVADHIICTLPLGVLKTFSDIIFSPELPLTKSNAIRNLGFGSPGKIFLEYDEPVAPWFVENIKLAWSLEELINRSNWITGISEITSVPNNPNVLQVKIGGLVAESIERYREEHIGRDVTKMLKKFMKKEEIPNPSRILRTSWSTDPKTLGGIAYLSITSNEVHVNQLAEPLSSKKTSKHPILQFAGDATSWHGFGSMEGARRSGVREAKRIIDLHS